MAPVLGYWAIRGLAQPIRLLLKYSGTEFEDKKYECGPPPDYDKSQWLADRDKLELPFANLPYYIDGDLKITQSNAILRHIARKQDLCGKTEEECVRVDIVVNQSMDFRNAFVRLCYNPNFENLKKGYLESLPNVLRQFSDFLGDNPWFAGKNLSFVDFIMYEILDQHMVLSPECLDDFQNLKEYTVKFESLPPIKKYIDSLEFMKTPLNNKMARFGGY